MDARLSPLGRLRAWLVTGAPGRAFAFVVDFTAALLEMRRSRRG